MITSKEELDEATRIVAGPTVMIEYIGRKPFATDNVAGSGKSWNGKGDVQAVTIAQAKILLKYADQWRIPESRLFGAVAGLHADQQQDGQAQAETQPPVAPYDQPIAVPVADVPAAPVVTDTPPAAIVAELESLHYEQMSDDALRLAFEQKLGRKPHSSTLRETLIAKLKGE